MNWIIKLKRGGLDLLLFVKFYEFTIFTLFAPIIHKFMVIMQILCSIFSKLFFNRRNSCIYNFKTSTISILVWNYILEFLSNRLTVHLSFIQQESMNCAETIYNYKNGRLRKAGISRFWEENINCPWNGNTSLNRTFKKS